MANEAHASIIFSRKGEVKMSKITELTTNLQLIYDALNSKYFDNELPEVILTIQTPTKASSRRSYDSWLYPFKWEDDKGVSYHEINLDPQHFIKPMVEIAAMLHHRMIHLYCLENGIKDTSRNFRYHNEKFRYEAENRGLICTKSEDMGWNLTDYSEEFEVLIGHIVPDDVFNIRRIPGDIPPTNYLTCYHGFLGENLGIKSKKLEGEPNGRTKYRRSFGRYSVDWTLCHESSRE